MVTRREVATAIVLSIITCGIYSIYWFVKLTDEVNIVTGQINNTSGGMAFLLTLITCGIYAYYWAYKMGSQLDTYENKPASRGILYIILQFIGLGIVTYALIQDSINKINQ